MKKSSDSNKAAAASDITFSANLVTRIALLSNLPVTPAEEKSLADGFNKTLTVVNQLFTVDVTGVEPTRQVTGMSNVFRNDVVDENRMLSQEEALKNSKRTYNGYFVVDGILEDLI